MTELEAIHAGHAERRCSRESVGRETLVLFARQLGLDSYGIGLTCRSPALN